MPKVRVETISEDGFGLRKATIKVFSDETLVAEVVASVVPKQGGDGGFYPCVDLEKKEFAVV